MRQIRGRMRFTEPFTALARVSMSRARSARAAALVLALAAGIVGALAAAGPDPKGSRGTDPLAIAQDYLRAHGRALRLSDADLADVAVGGHYTSRHNGVTHVYLRQRHAGIEVVDGVLTVNVGRDGAVVHTANRFVSDLGAAVNARVPAITAVRAVENAAAHLGLAVREPIRVDKVVGGPAREVRFEKSGISRSGIGARLMYLPERSGKVRLVWELTIEPDQEHYWRVDVDALTGRVLRKADLVARDSYKVYAAPLESPNHHPSVLPPADGRSIVGGVNQRGVSPGDPVASPRGWHDTPAGVPLVGTTAGNNVAAYVDQTQDDLPDPGSMPVSLTSDFSFPIDLTQGPETYRDALVTNLFYWNNIIHDIFFHYGFDEAAGNFQLTNYSGAGEGHDALKAEAQDGSGTNNANMLTVGGDGVPPRMQMFIFTPPYNAEVAINVPAGLGPFLGAAAGFGPPFTAVGTTGDVVLADDGVAAPSRSDGCEPITSDLTGKIAVVDRGTCNFTVKVKNAQTAGAAAVVVVNNAPGDPVAMGSVSPEPTIVIPSIMLTQGDGGTLKASLPPANPVVNATVRSATNPPANRDSDFDNGVIVHEYGHGISSRLTGGPNQPLPCLNDPEQGGEGWSDFFALVLTQSGGLEPAGGRGIGTYVSFQDPPAFGGGIRPYPYSTDPAVNPQRYEDLTTGTLSVPHGVGTVWASALWDLYWNLVRGVEVPRVGLSLPAHGFRQDLTDMTPPLAGNQIAVQLVIDGLKMQTCEPTFVEARDAILAADQATFGGAYHCYIWHAFAKRGVGVNARDGDGTLAVTDDPFLPQECTPAGCFAPPVFRGAEAVHSVQDGQCGLNVVWSAATPTCADAVSVTYSVYRSNAANFVPGPDNLIAGGIAGTSYLDRDVESGTRYYYIVRVTDNLGNTDVNKIRRNEVPIGGLTPGGAFADDAGDATARRFVPSAVPFNTWMVAEPNASNPPNTTRYYTSNAPGANYPETSCIAIESDTIYLGANPTLSFDTSWAMEFGYDGGIVEVATATGNFGDWTKLDTIDYPGAMLNDSPCPNPGFRTGEAVFNAVQPAFVPFSGSLAAYANQAVRIRFVLASDPSITLTGWQIDNVGIDDVQDPTPCTTPPPVAADLRITRITAGNNKARQGDKVSVTATVSNDGSGEAQASRTGFMLDGTTVLGVVDTPVIPPGGMAMVSILWDTRAVKGEHAIRATADIGGEVAETDETNNAATLTVTVQGNKVENGSFEQSNAQGSGPDAWSGSSTGAGTASWSDGGSDGLKSASTNGNGGSALLSGAPSWTSAPIVVQPGETLTLALEVRTSGASSAPTAGLVYLGAAGQVLGSATLITAPLTTGGFARLERAVTVLSGVAQVRVKLTGFAPTDLATAGTVQFDAVGLFGD